MNLGFTGFLGALPVAVWLPISALPLSDLPFEQTVGATRLSEVLSVAIVIALAAVVLVLPWLVPCLVLRARQPRGARIEWDQRAVVEWDGPWQRSEIPWRKLEARHLRWSTRSRQGITHTHDAVQLVQPDTCAAITVWTSEPSDVPTIRRRLLTNDVGELLRAIAERGIPITRAPDWSLVLDPERPPRPHAHAVGRLGYPLAVAAPLVVPLAPYVGLVLGTAAAVLLAVRATPVFQELGALRRRRIGQEPDSARDLVDRWRVRAVLAEAAVRAGCVLLTVWSTVVALLYLQ